MYFHDVRQAFGVTLMEMNSGGEPKITRRKLIKLGIGGAVAASLLNGFAWEPHRIRLQRQRIGIDGLGNSFVGYKVAILSDFHIPYFVSPDYVQRSISMLMDEKPDLFLLLGDFCNSKGAFGLRQSVPVPNLVPYFKGIAAPDGVLGVLGNHDYWLDETGVTDAVVKTPVSLLHNDNVIIRKGSDELAIVGTPDLWEADIDLNLAFRDISPSTPRILMQHNPDLAEQFPEGIRVDLQVSGHTHGGQVRIPFGPALILPTRYGNKYREGLVDGPRYKVYITRGVGMSSALPVRFCCPPEATLLELTPSPV